MIPETDPEFHVSNVFSLIGLFEFPFAMDPKPDIFLQGFPISSVERLADQERDLYIFIRVRIRHAAASYNMMKAERLPTMPAIVTAAYINF